MMVDYCLSIQRGCLGVAYRKKFLKWPFCEMSMQQS